MKEYLAKEIRNVAVLGHMGSGKTSLCESLLFIGKAIPKKGEVERKTTISDYLPEEQNRQTSLSTSLIPVEWNENKINVLDLPGSEEFVGELENVLNVVQGAVVVLDATKGIEVGTERVWEELSKRAIPTIFYINKMDKENIKIDNVIQQIAKHIGPKALPLYWPLGGENNFQGFFNVAKQKEHQLSGQNEVVVDAKMDNPKHQELYDVIVEKVAETSEDLLEKFFGGEELSQTEINTGLRTAIVNGDLYPIVFGSAVKNVAVEELLNVMVDYLPSPSDMTPRTGTNPRTQEAISREVADQEPFSAIVFKTIVDPFLGTINFFQILSGSTKGINEVYIPNIDQVVKAGTFMTMMGKNQISVDALHAGDIGAVAKMGELLTGYTFCDRREPILFEPVVLPTATIYVAIMAKTKQDEDKISTALQKLNIEDPSFEIKRNPETAQLLIGGQGMTHIGYILEKMKNMFKVDVEVAEPKIVYRETIRKIGAAQGRHKKQSGGAGQFGDVWIRFEPTTEVFEFASEVVGGSVPKNYFPAVEKGLLETLEHGPLAGFPVIGVRAVLYDGSYHPVDSNEISFKLAASLSFKEACKTIKPTILEPIMQVDVYVKEEFVGDVMGDMNKRRGQVLGIEPQAAGRQIVSAYVPEAEIIKYATDLKAMTQGSGHFTRQFVRYEEVPENLIAKIVEEYKKQ